MDGTIIQQGRFTSDGTAVELQIRSDVDWMEVYNSTQWATTKSTGRGVKFYWQRGLASGEAFEYTKADSDNALQGEFVSSGGFTLLDTSGSPLDTLNATVTAISTASVPVVSNSGTNGLSAGDVVRIINVTSAQQVGGFDFTVGNGTLTSGTFSLDYMSQLSDAGTSGSWRKIKFQPQFYPRHRFISDITAADPAVVTMTVTHGYVVGQKVRLKVPSAYGMVEADGLLGTITAVDTTNNTITLDIDSSAFTAFAFPATGDVPFSPAMVIPVGEAATSTYANLLDDATDNVSFLGMELGAGIDGPAGSSSDVIYWRAGKSFSVSNS